MLEDMIARDEIETVFRERERIAIHIVLYELQFVRDLREQVIRTADEIQPCDPGCWNVPSALQRLDHFLQEKAFAAADVQHLDGTAAFTSGPPGQNPGSEQRLEIVSPRRVFPLGGVQARIKFGQRFHLPCEAYRLRRAN